MNLLKNFKLVENGDGYELIIYFEPGSVDVEFAGELGKFKESGDMPPQSLMDSIRKKFPDKNINSVKLMLGTVLLSSFILGLPVSAQAAEPGGKTAQTQSAYNYNVNVSIDGKTKTFQNKPLIYNNITYVPVSEFGKALGAKVWWNGDSKTVGIEGSGSRIAFVRGSVSARVNGVQKAMPASLSIGGTTYAPLRFIAENLGYKVTLDSSAKTVDVSAGTNIYTVSSGDSLWKISRKTGQSVDSIKRTNKLDSDTVYPGQKLTIPKAGTAQQPSPSAAAPAPAKAPAPSPSPETPAAKTKWPDTTYIVQPGDTAASISKKFGRPAQDILKYNYMSSVEWFEAGDKIAISGYAPRVDTVTPGQATSPARHGTAVDWVLEGQYLVKRNSTFTVVDVETGKQFRGKMLGGYNHIDIEPLTASDTAAMKSLFGSWKWSPRPVVIYINGMNLAASLSGMPHGADTVDNAVSGHFDLYMKNSTSHSATTSASYIQEHAAAVKKASG